MSEADALSALISLFSIPSGVAHIILAIHCREGRWLNAIKAIGSFWLGIIFGLNTLHIVINTGGLTGGRPGTIVIMAALVSGAIYEYRNRNRKGC